MNWAYLLYAAGLAVITWRRSGVPGSPLAAHVTDLLIFSGFQYLTPGSSSPFFIFFLFSMFCGALRWGWRGTLITAAFVMVAYLSAAVVRPAGPAEFDLNRFVTRIVYLVVSAGFLAYLGLYEERLRGELERLAHWPVVAASGTAQGTRQILEYAARILNAGRAVVIWEAAEEPISTLAVWSADGFTISTHAPGDLTPLLPPVLERGTFLCATSLSETSTVLVNDGPGHLTNHTGIAIHPRLSAIVGGTGLASARVQYRARLGPRLLRGSRHASGSDSPDRARGARGRRIARPDGRDASTPGAGGARSPPAARAGSARRRAAVADRYPPRAPQPRGQRAHRRRAAARSPGGARAGAIDRAARSAAVHRQPAAARDRRRGAGTAGGSSRSAPRAHQPGVEHAGHDSRLGSRAGGLHRPPRPRCR